jgi:hypothetical protein
VIVTGDEFSYGELDFLPYFVEYSAFYPAGTFPGPACAGYVEDQISLDVATGEWGFSYELHNTIEDYDDNEFLLVFACPDPYTTLVRPGEARWPKNLVWTLNHTYGDNGIYYVDLMLIDDDMYWDTSGGYPVYVGPPGEEDLWISHNIVPVEVNNVDPVIEDVEAYVEGDLCLRLSGNKGNKATLEVFDGTTTHSLTLIRDPNEPEFGCIEDLHINMGVHANSYVKVIYEPSDDDGANPSWIVEGYWPGDDPHKIKVTFNSKKGIQEKYISFGDLFVNVPINFAVNTGDVGTDDLFVLWSWGDQTPHGVNIYANVDPTVPVAGFSDYAPRIFDQLPIRDPWFNKQCDNPLDEPCTPNYERSPWGSPISFSDLQQHAFSHKYYYFAHVTVGDDDNGDGYPSSQLNDGTDTEFIEINLT